MVLTVCVNSCQFVGDTLLKMGLECTVSNRQKSNGRGVTLDLGDEEVLQCIEILALPSCHQWKSGVGFLRQFGV